MKCPFKSKRQLPIKKEGARVHTHNPWVSSNDHFFFNLNLARGYDERLPSYFKEDT